MLPVHLLLQNRYQILRLIGQGGMGAVYEATDQRLGHSVAIKQIIHGEVQAFEREARLLARLRHSALPSVSDYFVEEVGHFLVMDLISGDDLSSTLLRRQQPFSLTEVTPWASQLLDALTYLHSQTPPILHRDIKPANLKLTPDGNLMLLDFGLAKGKVGEISEPQKTIAGYTLSYAAPEQIRGADTDVRSDLYAVAATFYHLLTGVQPPDAPQRALRLAAGHPDPLLTAYLAHTALPPSLLLVLQKSMALDPAERFTSAQTLHQALQTAIADQTIIAPPEQEPTPPRHPLLATPPLPYKTSVPHNLPAELTPLIGREQEIVQIQQLLQRSDMRLVTLTGAGGSGKTRLANAVASTLVEATTPPFFPDGVFLINLAPIRDPDLLISIIAQTVGVKETAGQPLQTTLQEHLRPKQTLLLLDNFEQIVSAAPRVSELLTTCPALKMLVTSREVLRLRGEHEFLVPLLAVPDLTPTLSADSAAQFASVELFVQRAQAVRPNFILNDTNAHIVAEICVRLDGLPLAIELAAARVKVLTPQALLARLGDRFALLSGGARDLPDRQRTLRATIDWSYDLLTDDEKTLFRRLAVFVGGRTLEAAEAVCNAAGDDNVSVLQIDILDGLASLVDKSLVYQEAGVEGERRFTLLATIHEYTLARLEESGEEDALRHRHLTYYLTLVEQAKPELRGKNQRTWLNRLEAEHDNLRAALQWSISNKVQELGLRLAAALQHFWNIRGYFSEGCQWLTSMLAQNNYASPLTKAKAFHAAGGLNHSRGDYEQAVMFHHQALQLWRELEDKVGIAYSLNNLGTIAQEQGDHTTARKLYEESLTLKRELGDKWGISSSLNNLGNIAQAQGDYGTAHTLHEESLALKQELGDKWGIALSFYNLGIIAQEQGDYVAARSLHEESLTLSQELGDKSGIAWALTSLGVVVHAQGDYIAARALHEESLTLSRQLGEEAAIALSLHNLANTIRCQGNGSYARSPYQESLLILRKLGWKLWIERSFREIALLFLQEEKPTMTVHLFGAAEALRQSIGAPIQPRELAQYEQNVVAVRGTLGEEAFATAWTAGQAMSLDQAIEYACKQVNEERRL